MSEVAVISGGAGAIGGVTVQAFAAAGFIPFVIDRAAPSQPVAHVLCDLTDGDLDGALAQAAELGAVTHLVSIAGGALGADDDRPSEPDLQSAGQLPDPGLFAASVHANLTGHYRLIHAAAGHLRAAGRARRPSITLTSSINALASYGLPAYSAAKAGLHGLAVALVDLLGPDGIRVNVVAPGTVKTPRTVKEWAHRPGHFERLQQTTATGDLTTPEQVAATMLTATTGQVIVADSGQMTHR